jgi:hypothetical protein
VSIWRRRTCRVGSCNSWMGERGRTSQCKAHHQPGQGATQIGFHPPDREPQFVGFRGPLFQTPNWPAENLGNVDFRSEQVRHAFCVPSQCFDGSLEGNCSTLDIRRHRVWPPSICEELSYSCQFTAQSFPGPLIHFHGAFQCPAVVSPAARSTNHCGGMGSVRRNSAA